VRSIGSSIRVGWQRFTPQHQLLLAIMGWPLLHLLEQGEDVFQWPSLLQYALLSYLLVLASRQGGWIALRSGSLKHVWVLLCCFVLYMTTATLVNSPIFLNGVVGYIKHVQFVPLLLVSTAIGLDNGLLRRWFVPYVFVLVIILVLPLALSAIGVDAVPARMVYMGPGLARAGGYVRYRFVFGNPNLAATFLACVMVFCLFLSVSQLRRVRMAIPVLGILLLGGYLVYMTLSRRIWLILPVAFVVGIVLQRGLRRRAWLILGIGLVSLSVLCFLWDPIVDRLGSVLLFRDAVPLRQTGPLHIRLIFWERVVGYLQRPIEWAFGLGAGTIGYAMRNYFHAGYPTVDGYYAVLLGEYGLGGLLLYCALVLAILLRLVRSVLQRGLALGHEGVVVGCLAGSLLLLLAGFVGNTNTSFPHALYLWSFLGIGLAVSTQSKSRGNSG